jgi:large repetitive protein
MKSCLQAFLVTCLFLFSFVSPILAQNIQFRVELLADNQTYRVLARPTVTWTAPNNNTLGAQVTLLARTGTLSVTNLVNINGTWTTVTPVVAPLENTDYDYFVFYLSASTAMPFTAGVETPLFSFKRAGGPCTTGQVGIINNFIDPFLEPNSQSLNVGNYFATQGGGGSSNNLWNGNYSAGSANCKGDCLVEYHLDKISAGKYRVSMTSFVNWAAPLNQTATQQVAIKVPTGNFTVTNLTNLTSGATYILGSRTNHPAEDPMFDYLHFNLQTPSTTLTYQNGTNVPLFTFENTGACSPGLLWLVDNATDPFMQPNSASINAGQQLTTAGYTIPDVPICVSGTGSTDCSVSTVLPCTPPAAGTILGADRTICAGQSTNLQVNGTYTAYAWTPITALSCANCANPTANPTTTTQYIVSVTNAATCVFKDTITVNVTPLPIISNVVTTAAGCGQNTGSIVITATGTGLEYSINNGTSFQTSNTFSALALGTYNVQVRKQGTTCVANYAQNPVTIGGTSAPTIVQVQSNSPADCGLNNGTINILAAAQGLIQYSINGGTTWFSSSYFTGLAAGSYAIAVRTSPTCVTNGTAVALTAPASPIINSVTPVATTNCGVANGSLTINASGGLSPLEYSINNGAFWQTNPTFTMLAAGAYIAMARNFDNTCAVASVAVLVGAPAAATITNVVATQATACGQSNASITITATAGQVAGQPQGLPLQYSIDGTTWQASNVFANLASGSYTVLVRNGDDSCPKLFAGNPVVLNTPQGPAITGVAAVNPTDCGQTANGSITIAAVPNTGVEYSINGGTSWQAANVFSGLSAGTFAPMVRVIGGTCPNTYPAITLTQPIAATISAFGTQDVSTCNANDGSIAVVASGGLAPLEYSIDGTIWQTGAIFSPLPAGTYTIRVRNYNGTCVFTHPNPAIINAPIAPSITNVAKTEAACGNNDGTITLTGTGGTGPLEFSIDGIIWQTGGNFANIAPGTYTAFVRNANNSCVTAWASNPIQMSLSPSPRITAVNATNITECGLSNGSINIVANSTPIANQPLQYSVNGGISWQATGVFQNLAAGTYNILVQNASGNACQVIYPPITILGQSAPQLISAAGTNPTNCGINDGKITILAVGGVGALEYSIDNVNWQNSASFQNLAAGSYLARVRNQDNSCVQISPTPIVLTAPAAISGVTALGVNPTSCGTNNGTITVNGGTNGIQYSINGYNWQTSNVFSNLAAGSYTVSVRKAEGTCVTALPVNPVTLSAGQGPVLVSTQTQDPQGCGVNNGSIFINATGSNLEYSINNGTSFQASNLFPNLASGTYPLVVRVIGTNCTASASTIIINPIPPAIASVTPTQVSNCGATNGSITVNATVGQGYPQGAPLQYSVNNGASWQASNTFSGLNAGGYTVSVRNSNGGCTTTATTTIAAPASPVITAAVGVSPTVCGVNNGTITVTAQGQPQGSPVQYSIDNLTWGTQNVFSNLAAGTYQVWVRNSDQSCAVSFAGNPVVLTAAAAPTITNTQLTQPQGCVVNGGINITATGNNLEYSINNGLTFQSSGIFNNLAGGTYQIVVRQIGSVCNATATATLSSAGNPAPISYYLDEIAPGKYQVSMTPSVTWVAPLNMTSTQQIAIVVPTGNFTVSNITNLVVGATYILGSQVNHPTQSPAFDYLHFNLAGASNNLTYQAGVNVPLFTFENSGSCAGGTISLMNNATDPYMNNSSNMNTGQQITVLGFGQPDAPVCIGGTGTVNCSATACVIPTIVSTTTITPPYCGASNTGSITVIAISNNAGLEYSINNGTSYQISNIFSGLAAGAYTVLVREVGTTCSASGLVTIATPSPATINNVVGTPSDCMGTMGTITITATPWQPQAGQPQGLPLQYSINGMTWQASNLFTGLSAGTFTASVRNANGGCTVASTTATIVTQPAQPVIAGVVGTSPSSCGATNGNITITANAFLNGQAQNTPLQYSIDGINWVNTNVFINLAPGSYNVSVRNVGGTCTTTYANNPVVLSTGQGVTITGVSALSPTNCAIPTNGIITINTTGSAAYQYSINNGATFQNSNTFTGLSAGNYQIVVRLQNNPTCSATSTAVLTTPAAPSIISSTPTVSICGGNTGSIMVNAVSGQVGQTLQYSIDNITWQNGNIFSNLAPGAYLIRVRYANGSCVVASTPVTVGSTDTVLPTIACPANVTVNANLGQSFATVSTLPLPTTTDNCSTPVLTYVRIGATSGNGTGAANGNYNVGMTIVRYTATDAAGNTAVCTFVVSVNNIALQPLRLRADSITMPCDGANQIVEVPVKVDNFKDVSNLRFTLTWDPTVLSIAAPPTDFLDNNNLVVWVV